MEKVSGGLDAAILTVADLFRAHRLEPASVQRAFQWTAAHAGIFLDDLLKAWGGDAVTEVPVTDADEGGDGEPEEEAQLTSQTRTGEIEVATVVAPGTYFLGTMVIQTGRSETDSHMVFDGLQRLTTLTILLCVMRDLIADADDPVRARLAAHVMSGDGLARLRTRGDRNVMARNIQASGESIALRRNFRNRPDTRSRILEIAADFRDRLKTDNIQTLRAFALFVLDRVAVCRIEPGSDVMGRQIFVTTNDRGLRLDQTDIFRSQLGLIVEDDEEAVERLLRRWRTIEEGFSSAAQREVFLQALDVLQRRQWSNQRGLTDLGEHLIARLDRDTVFHWIDDVEPQAKAWNRLYKVRTPDSEDPLRDPLRRLHIIEWPEWHPLALVYVERAQFHEAQGQHHLVGRIAGKLERLADACMTITLARLTPGVRQMIVLNALRDIRRQRNPLRAGGPMELTADQKRRARATVLGPVFQDEIYRPLARWIEASLWTEAPVPSWILSVSTEHVLPRALREGSGWVVDFPDEETRTTMAHRCGNLACLEFDLNAQADRADFEDKKAIYRQSKWMPQTLKRVVNAPRWDATTLEAMSDAVAGFVIDRLQLAEA